MPCVPEYCSVPLPTSCEAALAVAQIPQHTLSLEESSRAAIVLVTSMATDDDSDVPETGGVFTFGKSKFNDNVPGKFWVRNDPVLEVACGDEHTALVAGSGRVFTFGANDWSQLGLGDMKLRTKPCCVKSIKSEKIRAVACGRSSTYVATEADSVYLFGRKPQSKPKEEGRLYSYGGNTDGQLGLGLQESYVNRPQLVESIPRVKVRMLSAGADHAALLTEGGEVYVWGGGSEGQLGLGDTEDYLAPTLLKFKSKIAVVSCGYYHTAFSTVDGELYTFGEQEGGKLGLGQDPRETNMPQRVSGINGQVRMVACGGSHTVVVTREGRVFTFGDGSNGQLGHGNIQLGATEPQEVTELRDVKIHFASCGENHTAVVSYKGVLYTFGDGRHGKLGLGEENFANQFKPMAVSRFEGFNVERVACGGCHMLVLARPTNPEDEDEEVDESSEAEEEPKSKSLLRLSQDLDLSGSFQARSRRREKNDNTLNSSRTLPPLSTGTGRVLPPLSSTLPAPTTENPLNKSMLPPLKKPGFGRRRNRFNRRNGESSFEDGKKEESTESDEKQMAVKKESHNTLRAAPVPAPRLSPKRSPLARRVLLVEAKKEDTTTATSDSESDPKRTTIKPEKQPTTKTSPLPRPRFGTKVKPVSDVEETDSDDSSKKVAKKIETPSVSRKENSDSENEDQPIKNKQPEKKKDKRGKKQGGLFGKKKVLDSEESEEEDDSEESSEAEKQRTAKRSIFSRGSQKAGKNKQDKVKDKKGRDKKKDFDNEDSDSSSKKKNGSAKKSKEEEDEESSTESEKDKAKKGSKKDKAKEKEPPEKEKKSKLCTVL